MRSSPRPLLLVPALLFAPACGDDAGRVTASDTLGMTPSTVSDTFTSEPITDSVTPSTDSPTTSAGTTVASGVTDGGSSGEPATTSTSGGQTTGPVTASTTDPGTTTVVPGSSSGETSVGTTAACMCEPGTVDGCEGDAQLVCDADCQGFSAKPCAQGQSCKDGACVAKLCQPGTKQCASDVAYQTCNGAGDAFDPPVNCGAEESCLGGQCLSACAVAEATPSSVGCSFFANRMDNYDNSQPDSMIVGNTSKSKTATVQLYFTPTNTNAEQPQGGPVNLAPGKTVEFKLTNAPIAKASQLRKGGSYRAQSNIPVVAYQHSPIGQQATNDASMLLPEHALRNDHVIASYRDGLGGYPSYFDVIATADNTVVKWTPPTATLAGAGVNAVNPGQTGQVVMNRFDTLQVRVGNMNDISGTIVSSDKPIWVVGAVSCVNVPNNITYCDHIEEQMLPLDYWGKKYVGAHSPKRGSEKHYWRIYGGEDGTTVTANPAVPGTPLTVNRGEWKEIVVPNNTSTIFESDKPFLPVQYLEGTSGGAGTGDPASYQMIPVEQFLDRYAFVTGNGYNPNYAQIIRLKGNPDVLIDGVVVNGYYTVGDYEVSDWKISEGGHLAESDAPFGIINVGYTAVTSYAYPGGLKLEIINPQ